MTTGIPKIFNTQEKFTMKIKEKTEGLTDYKMKET